MPRKTIVNNLPTPRDEERRSKFVKRFVSDQDVKNEFGTMSRRLAAAELAWNQAKNRSLVSIVTSEGEFLLFGRLEQN